MWLRFFFIFNFLLGSLQSMANEEMLHSNNDTISMYYTEVPLIKDDSALNKKRFLIVNTSSLLGLVGSYYFINTAVFDF